MSTLEGETLVERLRKRADIRRGITTRKSVQEGKSDRIADLLEEAATVLSTEVKRQIAVGIACDGFTIYTDDKHFWFSQEESNEEIFKKMFKELGFDVTIQEDY